MGQSSTTAGVVAWGSAEHGQLGISNLAAEDRAVPPRLVEWLRSVHVRHVVCAGHHSCAVSESGEVYTWGCGKDGQLGHGDAKDVHMPKAVRSLMSKLIRNVSCAEYHVASVSESGVLYTWGKGQNGRLGHGGVDNESLPKVVEALAGQHVTQVCCGDFHTACVTVQGTHVHTWGLGLSGRLGHGDETERHQPTLVEALLGVHVTSVACGGHHTAVISEPNGQLMTWGGGAFGKLGHGNRLAQTTPKLVVALQGKKLVQVSLGPHHSAALTQKGEVFTWGQAGRLGHTSQGAEVDELLPRHVRALSSVFVLQVSCGHSHSAAVTETGDVWAWGASRAFGHTELNAVPNVPTLIKVLSGKAIVQVSCGVTHSIALSDYRRLSGKAALAAVKSMGNVAAGRGRGDQADDGGADSKKPLHAGEASLGLLPPGEQNPDANREEEQAKKSHMKGLPVPTVEREVVFLTGEVNGYREHTLNLRKFLQEGKTKLEALSNENSFLKSELEVMHQCSNDADERLDTLRRHFNDRILEMERRYAEKERVWKETFGRLRSHLEIGALDVDPLGGSGASAAGGPGPPRRPELLGREIHGSPATLGELATLSDTGLGEEEAGEGAPHPGGAAGDARDATHPAPSARAPERGRASGRVSLWPGGQS